MTAPATGPARTAMPRPAEPEAGLTGGRTAGPTAELGAEALRCWTAWRPTGAGARLRTDFLRFLGEDPGRLWRDGGPEHCTASLFVLDPAGERTLLTHHRKGGFWAQFGGHLEAGDRSLAEAALREGREESGVADLRLVSALPLDLHRHDLSAGFGACRCHWDTAFLATADPGARPVVSAESTDVAWWPVTALPGGTAADLPPRLAAAAGLLRGTQSGGRARAAVNPSR